MIKLLGLPFLASEHGAKVDHLMLYMHWLMGILFIGWMAYFVYVLIRFRKSRHPKASYHGAQTHASSYLEGAVALVEGILLMGFAIPWWAEAVDKFPSEKDATVINVTAEQFAWNSRYPGQDGIFGKQDVRFISAGNPLGIDPQDPHAKDDVVPPLNEITVPVNKPVIAYVTSKDVVHSFKINPLRVTQDAIPGMKIPVWFKPTHEGQFLINCAQLCGNSHFYMKGYLNVVSQEKYDEWLAEKSKTAGGAATGGFE
ncbi:MAG: cytochrome c oxidase subunit II [Chloroflexi bacterium]|nr:cytochrome c oxidase subunit II [Chloroflexota bacterium]